MKKRILSILFIVVEFIMMTLIVIYETLTLVVKNDWVKNTPSQYRMVPVLYVLTTAFSFLFVFAWFLYLLIKDKGNIKTKSNILVVYLFLTLVADLLFNLLSNNFYGYIPFLVSYLLIALFIYKDKYELIIRGCIYILFIVLSLSITKARNEKGIVGGLIVATLLSNVIILFVQYSKTHEKLTLILLVAQILALISDLSNLVRGQFNSDKVVNDIAAYLVWITYIGANSLIGIGYIESLNDKIN